MAYVAIADRDHEVHLHDPQSFVWDLSWEEFRNFQIASFLVFPAVYKIAKSLVTGKRTDSGHNDDAHRAPPRVMLAILIVHIPWALGLLWVSPWAFLFGYLIPLPLGSVCAQQRQYREHARLPDGSTSVHDLMCNDLERVLIPGGFFNYHILHHAFPEIPQRALPKLYKIIASTIDMKNDYYGFSPQLGLKYSYLNNRVAA